MRVVIADDSVLILERLTEVLSRFDRVEIVGTFDNGARALEGLRSLKPDLAIVDIKMPGLTGLEVLNGIRNEDLHVKCMILTFYSSIYFRQLAMAYGADYFFSKVDEFEKVEEVVAEMVMKEGTDHILKIVHA